MISKAVTSIYNLFNKDILKLIMLIFIWFVIYLFITKQYLEGTIFEAKNEYWIFIFEYCVELFLLLSIYKLKLFIILTSKLKYIHTMALPVVCICITEKVWQDQVSNLTCRTFILNYFIIGLLLLALVIATDNNFRIYYLFLILSFIVGLVCYYTYNFRGTVLSPNDILAIRTASQVMSEYKYDLTNDIIQAFRWGIRYSLLLCMVRPGKTTYNSGLLMRFIAVIIGVIVPFTINWKFLSQATIGSWDRNGTIKTTGIALGLLQEYQESQYTRPDGYKPEKAEEILESYNADTRESNGIHPNIVVIMNESFSDLKVLGDFESEEYMYNWNSRGDYILKGYVYSSVLGGGTCNSEYEFLTGNSMYFDNGYPYMSYDFSKLFNMTKYLLNEGYDTIAIHPSDGMAWNRENVYSKMGYNQFITAKEMEDVDYLRWYPDDNTSYRYVLKKLMDNTNDRPKFIFNVTMQNHGGFDTLMNVSPIKMGEQYRDYISAQIYLSCINYSDRYIKVLLDAITDFDEPTIVCLFGDHQPSLGDGFQEYLLGEESLEDLDIDKKQALYKTPYMVWANYNTGVTQQEIDMSINYLFPNVLNIINMGNNYTNYLLSLERDIPIINAFGYMDDGKWVDKESRENNKKLDEYEIIQYYMKNDGGN